MPFNVGVGFARAGATSLSLVFAFLLATIAQAQAQSRSPFGSVRTTNVCAQRPPAGQAPSAGGVAGSPLAVTATSHVVVMEYEAWFGPGTGIYPQANVTTCLQSDDMQPAGGYDSAAPAAIARHAHWLEQMGMDAITLDLTNNVSCIYDGDNPTIIGRVCPEPAFRAQQLAIRNNDMTLYSAWTKLRTRLKIVPLLGGFDRYALARDENDPWHRSALEKEIDDFGRHIEDNPGLTVLYGSRPLVMIYLGTPVDPERAEAIRKLLRATRRDARFAFELVAGYLDSQPAFWQHPHARPTGPIEIAPQYGFWSVVDRLNFWGAPPAPYFPTYTKVGRHVENMTASLATAGQSGWSCAGQGGPRYCPDAALRYCGEGYARGCRPEVYETLDEFMRYAATLQPTFLIVDQLNEFTRPDEGWNANTNDDAEPTREWGYSAMRALMAEIRDYRARCRSSL